MFSGYHQLPLSEGCRPLTAFRFKNRAFQFKYLLFGLTNGPSAWSRLMQLTLSGIENVVYYLDDILIFSTDLESHLETLEQVLQT